MAEATNPMNQNTMDRGAMSAANSRPVEGTTSLATDRPPMVTFAAVMMFILAGFQASWAIVEFFNVAWIAGTTYGTFNGYLWVWAILDLLIAGFSFYAGYDILAGGTFGYIYGVVVAGFSAIRWFFYLPAAPVLGIVVIAVDVLIIYGLVANSDYFRARASA
jgi:hypothetical protein